MPATPRSLQSANGYTDASSSTAVQFGGAINGDETALGAGAAVGW